MPEASAGAAVLPRRPNFVIVLADDLGWGEVGAYGQKMIETPNLDRLAAEGLRFTNAYSGAPLCAPSRASLLTGLHTGHSTVRVNPEGGPDRSLVAADVTFAEVLQLSGYRTACIGKWGFGPEAAGQASHPNARGFDEFFGYIGHKHAHQYWPSYLWHNTAAVQLDGRTYAPDLFLARAKRFIRESASAEEPFLLYFPTILPHSPSEVPGTAGRYEDKPWSRANRRHAAQVTRLDAHVGELVRTLREAGLAESTIVLFTSDNGPHREKGVTPRLFNSNGPFRGDKRELLEGGIRVPLIAWSPGLPRQRQVIDDPVASWDILPTLADFAGVPAPARLDGRSFRGLLTGTGKVDRNHLFWQTPGKVYAVRHGRWKGLWFAPGVKGAGPDGRFELYDLATDLAESNNLAPTRPAIAAELIGLINDSVGGDPRLPYGLRVGGTSTEVGDIRGVTVTLHNGSAVPWRDVRLSVEVPRGWRVQGGLPRYDVLRPGTSVTATFLVTGGSATKQIVSRARFSARGRTVRFRKHRKLTLSAVSRL